MEETGPVQEGVMTLSHSMIPSNTMIKYHAVSLNKTIRLNYFSCEGRIVFKNLQSIQWGINGATLSIPCK